MSRKLATGFTAGEVNAKVQREAAAAARRKSVRNIGQIPIIADIGRRERCAESLITFGLTYYGQDFWELSDVHKEFIRRIELVIRQGGLSLYVLPRGFGKSIWSRIAIIWAVSYGFRQFCPLIAATGSLAERNYEAIKTMLRVSPYADDFPEIAFPINALEGITHKCNGQTYTNKEGEVERTHIQFGAAQILLPATDGAYDSLGVFHENLARNSVIISQGLFAAVRGISISRWDGVSLRPDFALCDDPQDDESAASPTQVDKRKRTITNSFIGSGSHEEPLAVAMAATVIEENDLIEQLLQDPAWSSQRVAFLTTLPEHLDDLWLGEYRRIRQDFDRNDPDAKYIAREKATDYYRQNRELMDKGATAVWEECYSRSQGEISALQHAMNALIDLGEDYFNSEVQNKPRKEIQGNNININNLKAATNEIPRGLVPGWANCLTGAVDVHDNILYYTIVAWDKDNFSGQVIDYGVYPDQAHFYFQQKTLKYGIQEVYKHNNPEEALRKSVDKVLKELVDTKYPGQDGVSRRVDRLLIDTGYQQELIFRSILENDLRNVYPSKGEFYGAKGQEFNEVTRKRKKAAKSDIQDYGDGWRGVRVDKYQDLTRIFYDANRWKSFLRDRIVAPDGADGVLRFFAYDRNHDLLYDHCMAEKGTVVEAKGREVVEWDNKLHRDNHYWDCLVYSAIAASAEGCKTKGADMVKVKYKKRKRKRIGYDKTA